jgi:hypothetical protein
VITGGGPAASEIVETKTPNNDRQISVFCRQRFKKHMFLILQLPELEANPVPMSKSDTLA